MSACSGLARERLLSDLARLVPGDEDEERDRDRIAELVSRSPAPFDRRVYGPGHLTGSAIVLCPGRRQIVLLHHGKLGIWLQPGGHGEEGDEDALHVAIREVREETGLDARPAGDGLLDVDVHPIAARPDEPAHEHFDLRYLLVAEKTELLRSEESCALRWASLADLVDLGVDPGLLRAARKALSAT